MAATARSARGDMGRGVRPAAGRPGIEYLQELRNVGMPLGSSRTACS